MNKNYVFALSAIAMWSTMPAAIKLVLLGMPNMEALAISALFAFIFLIVQNCATGHIARLRDYSGSDILKMAGLGFLGLFVYTALYYFGLSLMTSQEACILNYLWPLMILIFSCIILHEALTVKKLIAMLLSFAGVVILILGNGAPSIGSGHFLGTVACITAAACYGLFSVLNKRCDYDQNIVMMISWGVVAVCSFVCSCITENFIKPTAFEWIGMLWLGIATDALAYLLWNIALNNERETAKIATTAYICPFAALAVSALTLGETIHLNAVVAVLFIIGGILLQHVNFKHR